MLEILVRKLAASGFTDIVINVHHFAGRIVRFVEEHDSFGVDIRFSDESGKLLETGGGIKKAMPLLSEGGAAGSPFLVHNVDILSNVDLLDFYRHGAGAAALLLVSERRTRRYLLFDEGNRLAGWTDAGTGEVKSPYGRLDVGACRKYAFAGVHLFSPRLSPYLDAWPDKFSVIDFYLSVCDREPIYAYPSPGLEILDVGKLDALGEAEDFLAGEGCRS